MKRKTNLIIIASTLIIMTMITTIGAISDNNYIGEITSGQCIKIPQICASCSYVNITIFDPDKANVSTNVAMTSIGSATWTYNFCETNKTGRYDITGEGDIEGSPTGFESLWFESKKEGNKGGIDPLTMILMLGLFGLFSWKIVYKFNMALGNMCFMLIGLGSFLFFVQRGEDLFGYGGLLVLIISSVKMMYDLMR